MIIFAAYRDWATKSCKKFSDGNLMVSTNEELVDAIKKYKKKIKAIIFVGWSTIVSDDIIDSYLCMCYHPSDLPKFRGGSPIQNQIQNGIEQTMGTLFKMNDVLDGGDIYKKAPLSLTGNMESILKKLSKNAEILIKDFVSDLSNKRVVLVKQNLEEGTLYKRRKPEMSEITIEDLQKLSGKELYDKIRSLGDPYPNAFIKTSDGKRLLLKGAELL